MKRAISVSEVLGASLQPIRARDETETLNPSRRTAMKSFIIAALLSLAAATTIAAPANAIDVHGYQGVAYGTP